MLVDWRLIMRLLGYGVIFVMVGTVLIFVYHWAVSLFGGHKPTVSTGPGQYHFSINGPSNQPPTTQVIYVPVVAEQKTTATVAVEGKKKEDPTDFAYRFKTNYFVELNGKRYEVMPAVKEDTKLQNNKIVLTQENQLAIKVDVPQPAAAFGAGINNHGDLAITADGRLWKNMNWWLYASRSEQAAGLKLTIYK